MALPAIFGQTWKEFIGNWCAGNSPPEDRETVEGALSTLFRIWPEREADIHSSKLRGLMLIAPAIENGITLSACEKLDGFANVLRRLKTGERAASSELTFAARMVGAGFTPILEPPLGTGALDAYIPTEEGGVYCEVIAPETSEAIEELKKTASKLATILKEQNRGSRVEVLLSCDLDEQIVTRVAEAVRNHPDSNEPWPLEETAVVSKRAAGNDPNVGPTLPSSEAAALIGVAKAAVDFGVRTAGIVRVQVTDARAKRLLYAESHHFSRGEMNLLVMDVTKIVSSLNAWEQLIARCFQPEQNRRFGAVALFKSGVTGEKMQSLEEWRVIPNLHAYKPLPRLLLDVLSNLKPPNAAK